MNKTLTLAEVCDLTGWDEKQIKKGIGEGYFPFPSHLQYPVWDTMDIVSWMRQLPKEMCISDGYGEI